MLFQIELQFQNNKIELIGWLHQSGLRAGKLHIKIRRKNTCRLLKSF